MQRSVRMEEWDKNGTRMGQDVDKMQNKAD